MVGGQVMIIFVGGKAFEVTPLNGAQWGWSIALAAISLPVAVVIRLVPDHMVARIVPLVWRRRLAPDQVPPEKMLPERKETDLEVQSTDDSTLEQKKKLTFIKTVRGGRVSHLKFKLDEMREQSGYNDRTMGYITGATTY